jgi:hypothetical protein
VVGLLSVQRASHDVESYAFGNSPQARDVESYPFGKNHQNHLQAAPRAPGTRAHGLLCSITLSRIMSTSIRLLQGQWVASSSRWVVVA